MTVQVTRQPELREAVARGIMAYSHLCDARDCTNMAVWQPGFRFWAKGAAHEPGTGAEATLGVKCCELCKAKLTVEDLVTDAGWQQIVAAFAARGKSEPDRASIELVFNALPMARA